MIDTLKDIPLFSDLDNDELTELKKVTVTKTFPKNTILFSEGDPSDSFYVIRSGKVNVGINDEEGREVILSILGPGEYFGEMALMDGEPRSAFVMTKEMVRLLIISKKDFKLLLSSDNEILLKLLKGLQKRLREANKKIESLALMDVYGRVARLLTQLAGGSGEEETTIQDKLTHQEIANMVGASREMVSRVLKELTIEGYISIEKKRITIHKKLPYEW
ncbi:Crp/Fnr family transcriptional regulator [Desulfonema ishimotonii]|uniref:Crp/Fnr family transcriptional regulator n=1 Tax=Desulfonema ishimotonii TaxID=45657 RepID=A0A401FYH1_9BACT|nr:Crp/Fnr family transcriptional regulator [Desulfonema ishimotonii]GBC62011.1 Crp/Fnr family transcriptional regulator [Desulfonema ishimotonii]